MNIKRFLATTALIVATVFTGWSKDNFDDNFSCGNETFAWMGATGFPP